ncbi:hypothetical protein [Cyanobium sp. ATX 6E8]|uniref:hypothetical protein n=1 Tax=Cyanobium sp. ATX 6E8 TaxID=2823701 RepID=UPI0020CCFA1B|nr:hypothetical protein [Cyanobium sp. ATX 6E8]
MIIHAAACPLMNVGDLGPQPATAIERFGERNPGFNEAWPMGSDCGHHHDPGVHALAAASANHPSMRKKAFLKQQNADARADP